MKLAVEVIILAYVWTGCYLSHLRTLINKACLPLGLWNEIPLQTLKEMTLAFFEAWNKSLHQSFVNYSNRIFEILKWFPWPNPNYG